MTEKVTSVGIEDDTEIPANDDASEALTIGSMGELIDFELDLYSEAMETHDLAESVWTCMTDPFKDELCNRVWDILEVVDPELAKKINEGNLWISGRIGGGFEFAICLTDGDEAEDHDHEIVAEVPDTVFELNDVDFKTYLSVAQFLDRTGILVVSPTGHCAGCGAMLHE